MKYEIVNVETWERKKFFRYYTEKLRNVLNMTVDVDVTSFLGYVRANGLKFYPAMIWAVSSVVNRHAEFKYGWDADGNLIRWDFISPHYTNFRKEEEQFVLLCTEYEKDLFSFHARFLADRERWKDVRAFDLENVPLNTFDVSCLPWMRYKSFDIHVFDEGKYLAPVVTWGKYEKTGEKTLMPLTMMIHHAVCDGFHLCRFFKELQELLDGSGNR